MIKLNTNLLKAQMLLRNKKISDVAQELNISKSALYRKLNGKSDFTRREIYALMNFLQIEPTDAMSIFFNEKVS